MTSSTSSDAPSPEGPPAEGRRAEAPRRLVYGRRIGHRLRPGRKRLLEELLPELAIRLPESGALDPRALFARPVAGVRLEIGFGAGEHLEAEAAAHPELGFIGVEPYLGGVARLLSGIAERGLDNVRILVDDARLLLPRLPDASIRRIDVLFPDPWPKKRHHKRRLVNRETVAEFARVLEPGGELRLATDDASYARWMLAALLAEPRLAWCAERAADWRTPWPDRPRTRYEEKALRAGRRPVYLRFSRRAEG
ncbi:MAG: tRNA (guanosine(46)-N7)-methyltransferase TrmB [Geminicoccaceae bacterium]|nr:tRNA (guanosine(46)-N7)-methyltransferase TrmB [Geminicoccaceae bacterium]MCX7630874.1 tRNA (guanosine(46)-N7)-methyltransferase TrmB [Geminicoccaceae bacterium]MDW8125868.1 tRNA (guanosine(46)-N7)-methyltransferase TrmB [Geminicoccaceae bacterium]